ncbi:hypothetical protein Bca52824_048651 [Brassica carinata]|uniref:Uncharacterized protein n=1 Tax=Brassica carinata TaxID=52824 RepID=A0A8X7RJI8_BRACI|nr:hypothetical protein Bca52824_048651 [Brassica carinata]
MEETTDVVKRKMTPSVPANYVSILQLRERWIKEKERERKEEEEEGKDEERRRNQHAEEQETIGDDPKKPVEDLDEMRLNQSDQKHWGRTSKKDESIDGGEARRGEEEETAAIGSESGEDEGLREKEKKRGRRKRYGRKKKITNQEVEDCGSIKPPAEMHTPVKDQIRVYKKKGENAMEKQRAGSREKAVTAIETQLEHLSIKRVEVNKHQSDHKHWGMNSKKDESTEDGEAGWGEDEETAAIGSEREGRRKRFGRKKITNQEVEECKPPEYTVKESNTLKDQIRVYRRKEEKAMGKQRAGSREKAVTAIETQLEHLSIKRVEVNKHQSDHKHWGMNSKKDESTEDGEAGWGEDEETAAIGSERGEDEGSVEKKRRGRRKRFGRKKKITNQEVEECKPPEYTVKESNTLKDQIRVYRRKEEKAMGNTSIEKAVPAIETHFEHLSIKRGQETKHLKAQTRSHHDLPLGRVRMPIETATMVWVKKGKNERASDGNGSGVKPLTA